jgi:amino acid transporter
VGSDEAAGDRHALLGWYATWSMALASLLGGGVFSVLWVVVRRAGALAWASFVLAGVVGLITAWSYARLAADVGDEGGGTFVLIRDELGRGTAAVMSGLLVVTYLMALAVYSTTFGSYLAPLFGLGSVAAHVIGVLAVLVVATLALWGIGNTASIEVGTVWPKALVLLALAGAGLGQWAPAQLATGIAPAGMGGCAARGGGRLPCRRQLPPGRRLRAGDPRPGPHDAHGVAGGGRRSGRHLGPGRARRRLPHQLR